MRASLDLRKHEGSEGARGGASGLARFDLGVARFPSPFALRKSQRLARLLRYPLTAEGFLGTFLKARSAWGLEL